METTVASILSCTFVKVLEIIRGASAIGITASIAAVGKGVLWADGEIHQRQRRSLAPAFNSTAIRKLAHVFYHSAYKVKSAWEAIVDAGGGSAVVDVQDWMNHVSLDTIGLAGFSHDFGTLDGKRPVVDDALAAFGASSTKSTAFTLLLDRFPFILQLPTPRNGLLDKLHSAMAAISNELHVKMKKEKEEGNLGGKEDTSVIGLLLKSEDPETVWHLSREEVLAQMNTLLVAGYETTAITMSWALFELARNPTIQAKLREELLAFGGEPTYDQLNKDLPYLDAVVHEILRLYPAGPQLIRRVEDDDVIPLSRPLRTRSGETVDNISVIRGMEVVIPLASINRSEAVWGPDAKVFRPERWLEPDGITENARGIPGHRHLLTFGDGAKTCLGKFFIIAEFKIVLSVVAKNFVFEMRDGSDTKVEMVEGILPRPKIAGEEGTKIPLRVRRYEG
ncbi:hypothetical protein ID866_6206 [Astraeus odoratus]|nr:hypothetical protein ID866_6206 [Astraeus odoratus]